MTTHTWIRGGLLISALALSATAATAQSNVNAYGLIDVSVGSTKAPGGSASSAVDSGKMTTSYLGFKGSEDLGDGLAAAFRLEGFLHADTGAQGRFTGDAMWARTASIGLSHKAWGNVNLGRNTTPLFVSTLLFNAFGDSFGYSPAIRHYFTSGTTTGDTGWSDSIAYSSPRWGGLSFGVVAALKEGSNGGNWSVNVGYSSGPLSGSLVLQDVKKDGASAVADTRTTQLSGAYDLGVAKLYGQWGQVENTTTPNTFDIAGLGAKFPLGSGAVLVQWGQIAPDTGAERQTVSAGYSHNLSKRTDVYAVLMHDKVEGLSAGNGYSVGIRHRF